MPHAVESRFLEMGDGLRVRHWVWRNSVKVYTEQNVLRTETTINNPNMFKVHRRTQGQRKQEPKRYLPMRKGVADIPLRAHVSEDINTTVFYTSIRSEIATGYRHTDAN